MPKKRKRAPKHARRQRVKRGIRKKVDGTPARPRLTVYRSNKHIYAQLIDDRAGNTLVAASSLDEDVSGDSPNDVGTSVGELLAERASDAGIDRAVFDRNGYRYHGRVKSLAEGAREGGLAL